VLTARAATALSRKLNQDTPIIEGIFRIIHGELCGVARSASWPDSRAHTRAPSSCICLHRCCCTHTQRAKTRAQLCRT
jgi:hypothetical protein